MRWRRHERAIQAERQMVAEGWTSLTEDLAEAVPRLVSRGLAHESSVHNSLVN